MLYYNTKAYRFAFISACLLVGQFAVVWMRVLPYLSVTYGTHSTFCKQDQEPDQPQPRLPHTTRATQLTNSPSHRPSLSLLGDAAWVFLLRFPHVPRVRELCASAQRTLTPVVHICGSHLWFTPCGPGVGL